MAVSTKTKVKESLIAQLQFKRADQSAYVDLVNDYMSLWDIKSKLIRDIKQRGIVYEDFSSVGVKMKKNNPSVKELLGVNRQMLAILKDLGLTADQAIDGEDDAL